jgi:DnaJ-class molecular chaperone
MSECPRCHDLGRVEPDCELCEGKGEVGLSLAVAWILAHEKRD